MCLALVCSPPPPARVKSRGIGRKKERTVQDDIARVPTRVPARALEQLSIEIIFGLAVVSIVWPKYLIVVPVRGRVFRKLGDGVGVSRVVGVTFEERYGK